MNRSLSFAGLLSPLVLAAAPASAEQAVTQHPETQSAVWTRAATPAEIEAAFKTIDPATLPPGTVSLRCRVTAEGTLTGCHLITPTRERTVVASLEGKPVAKAQVGPAAPAVEPTAETQAR